VLTVAVLYIRATALYTDVCSRTLEQTAKRSVYTLQALRSKVAMIVMMMMMKVWWCDQWSLGLVDLH